MSNNKANILKFVDPAIIATLITSTIYYLGYIYINSFFDTLAIDHGAINFPFPFYITEIISSDILLYLVLILIVGLFKPRETPKNTLNSIRKNIPNWMLVAALSWQGFKMCPKITSFLILLFAFLILILSIYDCAKRQSIVQRVAMRGLPEKLAGFIVIFLVFVVAATALGKLHAEQLIKGENVKMIEFTPRSQLANLNNQPFIYIMHHADKYYVMEESQQNIKNPKLIVIPDREVIKAVIYRKN